MPGQRAACLAVAPLWDAGVPVCADSQAAALPWCRSGLLAVPAHVSTAFGNAAVIYMPTCSYVEELA